MSASSAHMLSAMYGGQKLGLGPLKGMDNCPWSCTRSSSRAERHWYISEELDGEGNDPVGLLPP